MEVLFLVEQQDDGTPFILGKLEKLGENYQYRPSKLSSKSSFRWAATAFTGAELPPFIQQRIFSKHNIQIEHFLKLIHLDQYDAWEILKRTGGTSPRDGLKFLTRAELAKQYRFLKKNSIKSIQIGKKPVQSNRPIRAVALLTKKEIKQNLGLLDEKEARILPTREFQQSLDALRVGKLRRVLKINQKQKINETMNK